MSHFPGLSADVIGIVLIGAEGCSETTDEAWLRDATTEERQLFIAFCRQMIRQAKGEAGLKSFEFSEFTVDGTGRPYWLKAILDVPSTPPIARAKAARFTRVLRVHSD